MVNFDCPNHYEDYVHRCGRTGRAGKKGWAYTFITEEEAKYAGDIMKARVQHFSIFPITPKITRIPAEHIDPICSLESRLSLGSICSIRILNILKVIAKCGTLMKALEMSKTEVPSKLSNLWERYKLEQERAGKAVHKNSGFAGTGFKFDEAEKQMDKDRKNMQKAALGLAVSFIHITVDFKYKGQKVFGDFDQMSLVPG